MEPIFYIHSPDHIRAALKSTGFENARFTLLTSTDRELYRERVRKLEEEYSNLSVKLLDSSHLPSGGRMASLRRNHFTLKVAEDLLRRETFDLVAYLMMDLIIPHLAHPLSRWFFPAHRATGNISGILFRNNGLRPTGKRGWRDQVKDAVDRRALGRAIKGGWFRKLAFFDHRCTVIAQKRFNTDICVDGVDPIDLHEVDQVEARRALNLPAEAKIALFFGAISDRKSVVETLDILTEAPNLSCEGITLLIGGPVDPPIRSRLEASIARARKRFNIIFHDGFIADEALPIFFGSADIVICTYKNFHASSGTLLHAAAYGKPALVSAGGVMQDAVDRYRCGEVASFSDPAGFVSQFSALIYADLEAKECYRQGARRYAQTMDSARYMTQFV